MDMVGSFSEIVLLGEREGGRERTNGDGERENGEGENKWRWGEREDPSDCLQLPTHTVAMI